MSGVEVIAVVACVAAVISAYHDGSKVFQDIRRKWRERRNSHPQAASATDLENSLQRSRDDILTQWNGHVGRLGPRFETGDEIAQSTMKDILIGLQITLLSHLRDDGAHLDIFAVLNISDLTRARTISAMHELYQRLAQSAPIPWQMTSPIPPGLPIIDPQSGLAQYIGVISSLSSSQHPHSPEQPSYRDSMAYSPGAAPPHQLGGRVLTGSISSSPPEMTFTRHRPSVDASSPRDRSERRLSGISSFSSTFNSWLRDRRRSSVESSERSERDERSDSIPSASTLPSPPVTSYMEASQPRPIPRQQRTEPQTVLNENPWISVIEEQEQEREEYARMHEEEQTKSYIGNYHNAPVHTQQQQYQYQHQNSQRTPSFGHRQGLRTPPPTRPSTLNPPQASQAGSIHSDISNESGSSNRSDIVPISLSTNSNIALWPPSRSNDYAGFCKGAWKQNSGFEGFKVHSVPIGYYSLVPKWKCVSCFFEMPMASNDSHSQSGRHARFDEKIYTHTASQVRYRWSFLAKSHIARKTRVNSGDAAKIGTFGCMFCCFENDRSVLAFGSLDVFMNHLGAVHRQFDGSLVGSTRCIVGRVAGVEENFDINILPA